MSRVDVDAILVPVSRRPVPVAVCGELVAPADELVDAFALTHVASVQTQRTYERACRRFVRWLGPLVGPQDVTPPRCRATTPTWSPAGARARPSRRTAPR